MKVSSKSSRVGVIFRVSRESPLDFCQVTESESFCDLLESSHLKLESKSQFKSAENNFLHSSKIFLK